MVATGVLELMSSVQAPPQGWEGEGYCWASKRIVVALRVVLGRPQRALDLHVRALRGGV